jgi:hypothetical protein
VPKKNNFAKDGYKYCSGCKKTKVVDEFGKQSKRKDGLAFRCKSCMRKYLRTRYKNPQIRAKLLANTAKWRDENPDAEANKHLKRKYGITIDDYNRMFAEQGGVCAICKSAEKTRRRKKTNDDERLAVDHCHETGVVRGLLCFKCNTAMGSLGDSQDQVMRVIHYLSKSLSDANSDIFRLDNSKLT